MKMQNATLLILGLAVSQMSIAATQTKYHHKTHKKITTSTGAVSKQDAVDRVIYPADPNWKLSSINMSGDEPVAVVIVGGGFYYVKEGSVVMGRTVNKITYDYVKVDDFELSMAQENNFTRSKPE